MPREVEVFPGATNRVRQIPIPCGVLTPWAFLPVSFALPLNPSPTPDEIIVSSSEPVEDQILVSLVATRFPSCLLWRRDFILSGKCKLKNLQPHEKLAAEKSLGTQLFSDSFMPGDGAFSEAAQAQPKASINMPVPCLPNPRGPKGRGPSAQALLPTDSAEEPEQYPLLRRRTLASHPDPG